MKTDTMTTKLAAALVCALAFASCATVPARPMREQRSAVVAVVQRYETALNAADTDAIVSLYTGDAVFMPQHMPAVVGRANVHELYRKILATIRLDIEFTIDEVEVTGDWAWIRTRSVGTTTVLETGATHRESNQELFVLRRGPRDEWRIARYIFTSVLPRRDS